jgi:predicted integral membrane protein DUF2269
MNLYTLALFLHVSGAIGACVSLGIWLFGLAALRRARRLEQVRALAWLIIVASPLMVFSALLIALTGLDMALSTWGLETGWIVVALVSFVLMAPVGPFLLAARMYAILAQTREEPDGPLSAELDRRIHDPIMGTAANTLATVLLGIIFLMTTKPQLVTSLLVMVIAFLLGLFSSLPFWRAAHIRSRRTSAHASSADGDPFLKKTIWTRRW